MIRAAENMGARAEHDPARAGSSSSIIDFDSLPGKSPRSRAEALYMGRRIRDRLFPEHMFSEPAWDLLLALFLAIEDNQPSEIEPVLVECGIPRPTGLRYVALLEEMGLVEDRSAPGESSKRVTLSQSGLRLLNRFFDLTEGAGLAARSLGQRRTA